MFSIVRQVLQYFRKKLLSMLFLKLFPLKIDIIICQIKSIHNVDLVCSVKDRRRNVKSKSFRRKTQVDLKHLSDIHTRRHTKRIQNNIQRAPVRKKRHILYRKHTGNDTLVTVTSGHLISYRYLSLLRDVNSDRLIYPG